MPEEPEFDAPEDARGPRRPMRVLLGIATCVLLVGAVACTPSLTLDGEDPPGGGDDGDSDQVDTMTYVSDDVRDEIAGCEIYPRDSVFNADVTRLPIAEDSDAIIEAAGGVDTSIVAGFYSSVWMGSRGGMPVNVVDSRTLNTTDVVGGAYSYISDLEDHPIPAQPKIEGYPGVAWDKHMIVLDSATCVLSEFFWVTPPNFLFDFWQASKAVKLDLASNVIRKGGSATASGMPMLALMVRYDEVAAGEIDHMLQMNMTSIRRSAPQWPATGSDGTSDNPNSPAMGTIFRLKADVDLSGFPPQSRAIAEALKEHGAVVGDNSSRTGVIGENSEHWDDQDLRAIRQLTMDDFEVVDAEPMKVADRSYEIR
ncbi:MAG: hypothetical protein ACK5O2_06125 [Microthrixaceae bacterium]